MAAKVSSGGGGKRGRADVTADPNVIPFIDVMLVLLIIFMIAAPISTVDIKVTLPPSKIFPSKRPPRPTWISIKEEAGSIHYYVMNDEVQIQELGERTFTEWQKNAPDIDFRNDCLDQEFTRGQYCRIYIRGDGDIEYRNVVRVMNQLQNKGFTRIAFVAEDKRR
ncbi:MAG: biopolymer transporter ExbD [Pseudomonadota bacterium]